MANIRLKWKGKTINGVWKILEETNKRSKANSVIYKCLNLQNNQIYYKSSAYLKQFEKRKSTKLTKGKDRKWYKIPVDLTYKDFIKLIKQYALEMGIDLPLTIK